MDPLTIASLAQIVIQSAGSIKSHFFDNNKIDELRAKSHANVSSLADQVAVNKAVLDEVIEQLSQGKEAIERHNEVLMKLGQVAESTALELKRLRALAYGAIGVACVSVAGLAWVAVGR